MPFARRSLKTLPNLAPSPFDRRYGRRRTKKGRSPASVHPAVRECAETRRRRTERAPFAFVLLAHRATCTCHPQPTFQQDEFAGEHVESWFRIPHLGQYRELFGLV
ncbi:hypothetical protein DFH06DRAFT_1351792 [Mycena polygramma]|nr:hypothetical protein DFH06DRAFT_1351792 [Mycena polygramma]